jgi:hypothetical protein
MAVISEGERTAWVELEGRRIKIYATDPDQGLQSINVCDGRNIDGEYEEIQYFQPKFHITAEQTNQFEGNFPGFRGWIHERAYQQARRG